MGGDRVSFFVLCVFGAPPQLWGWPTVLLSLPGQTRLFLPWALAKPASWQTRAASGQRRAWAGGGGGHRGRGESSGFGGWHDDGSLLRVYRQMMWTGALCSAGLAHAQERSGGWNAPPPLKHAVTAVLCTRAVSRLYPDTGLYGAHHPRGKAGGAPAANPLQGTRAPQRRGEKKKKICDAPRRLAGGGGRGGQPETAGTLPTAGRTRPGSSGIARRAVPPVFSGTPRWAGSE